MQGQDLNWITGEQWGWGVGGVWVFYSSGRGPRAGAMVSGCWHIARFEVSSCTFDVTSCLTKQYQKGGYTVRNISLESDFIFFAINRVAYFLRF